MSEGKSSMSDETVINDSDRGNNGKTVINTGSSSGTVINSGSAFSAKLRTAVNAGNTGNSSAGAMRFSENDVIAGRYLINRKINRNSGEADIFEVKDLQENNTVKALKLFRRKDAIKSDVLSRLMNIDSPYVAAFSDKGEINGFTYLVMPYYGKGSLASYIERGITFSPDEIRTLILPSVLGGLKAVHDAGIIHKDLKPANMMIADDESHIVLIDFGISSVADGGTMVVTQTGRSPFYSAPETATGLFWTGSDYYSLGISLYELNTGSTPYGNAEIEDVTRYALAQQIPYAEGFDPALKDLIDALTYRDISFRNDESNPNRRWGHDEISRWLRGEPVPVPGRTVRGTGNSDYPYVFNGRKYFDTDELVTALLKSWKNGKKEVFRGFLTRYFALTENETALRLCQKAEQDFSTNPEAEDSLFFRLMYGLSPNIKELRWYEFTYPDPLTYAEKLKKILKQEPDSSHPLLKSATALLTENAIDSYLNNIGKSLAGNLKLRFEETKARFEYFMSRFGDSDDRDRYTSVILVNAILNEDNVVMGRTFFSGVKDFRAYISTNNKGILGFTNFCRDNAVNLEKAGATLSPEVRNSLKEQIPQLYTEQERTERSMLCFDGYVFTDLDEAVRFFIKFRNHTNSKKMKTENVKKFEIFKKSFETDLKTYVRDTEELAGLTEKLRLVMNPYIKGFPETNKTVTFGKYFTSALGSEKQPVKWFVLDRKTDGSFLLLSTRVLTHHMYDNPSGNLHPNKARFLKFMAIYPTLGPLLHIVFWLFSEYFLSPLGIIIPAHVIGNVAMILLAPYVIPCIISRLFLYDFLTPIIIIVGIIYFLASLFKWRSIFRYIDERCIDHNDWRHSDLREWLNSEFINEAFSEGEQKYILSSRIPGNGWFNATNDRIFVLSLNELQKYADNSIDVKCDSPWWLRGPCSESNCTAVNRDGTVSLIPTDDDSCGVRVALWVKM